MPSPAASPNADLARDELELLDLTVGRVKRRQRVTEWIRNGAIVLCVLTVWGVGHSGQVSNHTVLTNACQRGIARDVAAAEQDRADAEDRRDNAGAWTAAATIRGKDPTPDGQAAAAAYTARAARFLVRAGVSEADAVQAQKRAGVPIDATDSQLAAVCESRFPTPGPFSI